VLVALFALVAVCVAQAPDCPIANSDEETIQFPNPSDCGSFWKCDQEGNAILNECPPGLDYNPTLQVCDYPADAGCRSLRKH
ncbi:Peritrophin-1, partial [Gryllus bimaculatus]